MALRAAVRIRANADVIVTINLRDFPSDITAPFGIEAHHPDDFVLTLLDSDLEAVVAAAESHRLSLKNPAKSLGEYLEALQRQGLVGAVQAFRSPSLQVLATGHRLTGTVVAGDQVRLPHAGVNCGYAAIRTNCH